jgi:hypothetical protein
MSDGKDKDTTTTNDERGNSSERFCEKSPLLNGADRYISMTIVQISACHRTTESLILLYTVLSS